MSDAEQPKRPATVNAVMQLQYTLDTAERIRESAEQYMSALTSVPRPSIEIGGFYTTFDGSFVNILKRNTRCQCASCTGREVPAMLFGTIPITLPAGLMPKVEHIEPGDEPIEYVAVVLRGGHRLKGYPGEGPGGQFVLDADGMSMQGNPNRPDGIRITSSMDLGIAALSLKTRLVVSFIPEETAAAKGNA